MSRPRGPRRALPISDPVQLNGALARLETRERRVVELRYGIGKSSAQTLDQIGRRFGVTGERVRQIETRALQRLGADDGNAPPKPSRAAKRGTTSEAGLPRNALQAWTLLLLRHEPGHGYDLLRRLDWPGADRAGPRLYRLLRDLEQEGMVRSVWTEGADGPERRVYRLTRKGARQLTRDAQGLHRLSETLERFFEDYAQAWGGLDSGSVRRA